MPGKHGKNSANTPLPAVPTSQMQRRINLMRRMGFLLLAAMMILALVNLGQMLYKWQAGQTQKAFFKAVIAGRLTVVRQMVSRHPALLHARYSVNGATPLQLAEVGQHADVVALLLQRGADSDAIDYDGATPLYTATEAGDLPTMQLLIARGAQVNYPLHNGFTPLDIAAARGRADLVTYLLDHGANSTAITQSGLTPLHIAARSGAQRVVELLLAHGADPHARDRQGHTPADLARAGRHDAVAKFLAGKQ